MAYSHEGDMPDQYFLHFYKWDFYVYAFYKYKGCLEKDEKVIYQCIFDIYRIVDVSKKGPKEYTRQEIMSSLEGGFQVWIENHSGRKEKNTYIESGIQFGGDIECI